MISKESILSPWRGFLSVFVAFFVCRCVSESEYFDLSHAFTDNWVQSDKEQIYDLKSFQAVPFQIKCKVTNAKCKIPLLLVPIYVGKKFSIYLIISIELIFLISLFFIKLLYPIIGKWKISIAFWQLTTKLILYCKWNRDFSL